MRILIDLQACQSSSRFRGIGRYAMSIAKAIAKNAGKHEIFLALNSYVKDNIASIKQAFQSLVPPERIVTFAIPGPLVGMNPSHAWRARAAELIRWHALMELQPDIIYVSSLFEGFIDSVTTSIEPFTNSPLHAVTLFDLIPLKNQEDHLPTAIHRNWYFNKLKSLNRASLLLAISQYTMKEAIASLQLEQERIVNISAGVSECFSPISLSNDESSQILSRYSINRPFLLYTGNLDPNKNLGGTIQSYAMLPNDLRKRHQLVIVSQMNIEISSFLRQLMLKCGLNHDEVVLTDYVPDEHLVKLYNLCKAFVFPSLYEGFGLPVLEAMSCGAACIGSKVTSIPEVIGRQDALFDPYDPESISCAMHKILTEENFRRSLREHAIVQASRFSWDVTAARALTAFEQLVEKNQSKSIHRNLTTARSGSNEDSNYSILIKELSRINAGIEPTEDDIHQAACSISINEAWPFEKQLFIDVSTIISHDAKTGIQRVVRSVLRHIYSRTIDGYKIRPVYGDYKIGCFRYAESLNARLSGNGDFQGPEPIIDYKRGDIFLGLDLSAHLFPAFSTVFSNFRAIGVKSHFVIYDILPLLYTKWFAPGMQEAFIEWMKAISLHAESFICISAAVADEVRSWIERHPPLRPDKLHINHFHLGADIDNSIPTTGMPKNASNLLSRFGLDHTFLMVGTIEPRKGHPQVLSAFEQLWEKGEKANLVIVGKEGWRMGPFIKKLREHRTLGKNLFWLDGISDEFLNLLYLNASALIAASEAEGFGLPLIEAAQHKLPIIARDIPVFREVAGEYAYYFNGLNPTDLQEAIVKWISLKMAGQAPGSYDMPWLTWDESTKMLLDNIILSQK